MSVEFGRIKAIDLRSGFRSGEPSLDTFFQRHALSNDRINIGRSYVLRAIDEPDLPSIVGFITVSMCAVDTATLSDEIKRKDNLPRYPMPAALIGRLATDERARGRGYGERLLGEALDVILATSELIACFGVITDAKNDRAVSFYEKYGFELLPVVAEFPKRMFIALETVRSARANS